MGSSPHRIVAGLLVDGAFAGEKFLKVATDAEEGVLHIIGGAMCVARYSARTRAAFVGRNRSRRGIGREGAV